MSTMMTYEAMIKVCTIIRMRMGVYFRKRETVSDDIQTVKIKPTSITSVFTIRLVTAKVEQMPRICLSTGLSFHNPVRKISFFGGRVGIYLVSSIDPQSSFRK